MLSVPQDRGISAIVALWQRHEFQAATFVLVVVPLHEFQHPFVHLNDAAERLFWVVRPVFSKRLAAYGFQDPGGDGDNLSGLKIRASQVKDQYASVPIP